MNNDRPQVQPDYSFILDQQTSLPPKRTDKKVWLLFGSLAMLAIVVLVSVVTSVNKKVASPNDSPAAAATKQVTSQYFSNLAAAQYDKAFDLFSTTVKNQINVANYKLVAPQAFGNIDTAKCTVNGTVTQTGSRSVINYFCPTRNNQFKAKISFIVSVQDQDYRIEYYDISAKDLNATS